MTIYVKFFASLREQTGIDSTTLSTDWLHSIRDLWSALTDQPLDETTLVAVNKTYAGPDHAITDGDEVAFFPPITGG